MQQGNRHCTANIRNTRAHNSRGRRIRKRRNRTLQVVGRFLTLFVLTLVLAVGIMLSGAALTSLKTLLFMTPTTSTTSRKLKRLPFTLKLHNSSTLYH